MQNIRFPVSATLKIDFKSFVSPKSNLKRVELHVNDVKLHLIYLLSLSPPVDICHRVFPAIKVMLILCAFIKVLMLTRLSIRELSLLTYFIFANGFEPELILSVCRTFESEDFKLVRCFSICKF